MKSSKTSGVIAGGVLILCSLAALMFMTHHPTLGDPGYDTISAEVAAEASVNTFVHGGMIIFVLGYYFGITHLAQSLCVERACVSAGKIAFATATVMMIGAPLASGFVIPGLAQHLTESEEFLRAQIIVAGTVNQVLAKGGSAFYGAGIVFMSGALFAKTGLNKIIALYGLIAGSAIALSVLSGILTLGVIGMSSVIAAMGIWFTLVGLQMIRGTV